MDRKLDKMECPRTKALHCLALNLNLHKDLLTIFFAFLGSSNSSSDSHAQKIYLYFEQIFI